MKSHQLFHTFIRETEKEHYLTPVDFVLLNKKRVKTLMKLGLHDARTQLNGLCACR